MNNSKVYLTGINAAVDNTLALFASFADDKKLCVLRASAVNYFSESLTLRCIRATYAGAALAANSI